MFSWKVASFGDHFISPSSRHDSRDPILHPRNCSQSNQSLHRHSRPSSAAQNRHPYLISQFHLISSHFTTSRPLQQPHKHIFIMTILLLRSAFKRQTSRFPQIQRRLQSSPRKTEEAVPVPSTVAPLPLWQRLGPLTTAARAYARAQSKSPYRTQVATAVVIYIAADLSAQYVSDNEYDPARTLRNAVIGGLAAIPNYKW
jgi:hypothetical protein